LRHDGPGSHGVEPPAGEVLKRRGTGEAGRVRRERNAKRRPRPISRAMTRSHNLRAS
jgi:hypothetical protein